MHDLLEDHSATGTVRVLLFSRMAAARVGKKSHGSDGSSKPMLTTTTRVGKKSHGSEGSSKPMLTTT